MFTSNFRICCRKFCANAANKVHISTSERITLAGFTRYSDFGVFVSHGFLPTGWAMRLLLLLYQKNDLLWKIFYRFSFFFLFFRRKVPHAADRRTHRIFGQSIGCPRQLSLPHRSSRDRKHAGKFDLCPLSRYR